MDKNYLKLGGRNLILRKSSLKISFLLISTLALAFTSWKIFNFSNSSSQSFIMAGGVSGSVFRDYNGDGIKQPNEPLVGGVTVTAYDATGTSCGSDVTSSVSAPNYTIMSCMGQVRIEFTIDATTSCVDSTIDFSSTSGGNYGSSVQFANASAMPTVNFALNNPADYNKGAGNTNVYVPCYTNGDPTGAGTAQAGSWFVGFPYNNSGVGTPPAQIKNGTLIGATWGVAYSKQAKKIFTSAFIKRHVGLGTLGSGGIYTLIPSGGTFVAATFYDMDASGHRTRAGAGAPAYGPGSSFNLFGSPSTKVNYLGANDPLTGKPSGFGVVGTNLLRGLPANKSLPSFDPAAFAQVGKVGLGDLEISDDGKYLFVTNLYSRFLFRLTLDNPANPSTVTAVDSFQLPPASCTNGEQRPFGLKYYRNKLYIGTVCTGENYGINVINGASDISAQVYVLPNTVGMGPITATPVFSTSLNYKKGPSMSWTGPHGGQWNPWRDSTISFGNSATARDRTYPTPQLSDIEFSDRGDLILSFTDRAGHQYGWGNYRWLGGNPSELILPVSGGDLLVAGLNCSMNSYVLENNGSYNSDGIIRTSTSAATMQGPGGDEFFDFENIACCHQETHGGSVAVLRGDNKIITSAMDPTTIREGGTIKFSFTDGTKTNGYQLFVDNTNSLASGNFGKAAGLGDMEVSGFEAPLEIGNRVWVDANMNGVQDPGEAAFPNITIQLVDSISGAIVGTDITDVNGNYYFDSTNVLQSSIKSPQANRTYYLRIGPADWVSGGAGTADLLNYTLTGTDQNPMSLSNADLRDNDGSLFPVTMVPTIKYRTGNLGENNHTLDFGFFLNPPVPPVVDLALKKTIDTIINNNINTNLTNGDTVKFKIQLINQGELAMDSIRVTDYLPAGFKFVNATGFGQRNEGWNGADPNNPVFPYSTGITVAQTAPVAQSASPNSSTLTLLNHNPGNGLNRLLLVGISLGNDDQGTPPVVTGVTFLGNPMSLVGTFQNPGGAGTTEDDAKVAIYSLINPTGIGNVVISLSNTDPGAVIAQAVTFNGVDQTNPLGPFQSAGNIGSANPSANFVSAPGELLYTIFAKDGGTLTSPGDQTTIFNATLGSLTGALVLEPGAASVTTSFMAPSQDWSMGAVSIKPAPFRTGDTLDICIYTTLTHVPGNPTSANFTNYSEISYARDTAGVNQSANDIDSPLNNNPNDNGGGQPSSPADDYVNGNGTGTIGDGVAATDQDNHDPALLDVFDLALKKTIDPASVSNSGYSTGQNVVFNITITNQGTITAQNIQITDTIPCGLTFNPTQSVAWVLASPLATYTVPGPLAPGQSITVPINLLVNSSCIPLYTVNYAQINAAQDISGNPRTGDIDGPYDQNFGDDAGGSVNTNSDDVITGDGTGTPKDDVAATDADDQDPAELLVFDLALRKIISPMTVGYPGPYNVGAPIRFDITIVNQGNLPAVEIDIVDTVPAGLQFDIVANAGLWTAGPEANEYQRTIFAFPDTLKGGEDTTVSIYFTVLHTSGGVAAYTNVSEISSAITIVNGMRDTFAQDADSPYDSNFKNDAGGQVGSPADNAIMGDGTGAIGDGVDSTDEDAQDPALVPIVDVALSKVISDTIHDATNFYALDYGDVVVFDITVTNQGTVSLDTVEVTDYIPSGFAFGTNPNWTFTGPNATTVIRSRLDPGEDTVITLNLILISESNPAALSTAWINYAEVSRAYDTLGVNVSLLDFDSELNTIASDNAGGQPESPADNYIDGDGSGVIGDGVAATDQDNHDPALVNVFDLALRKVVGDTLGNNTLEYGDTIRFDIQIFNQANTTADSIVITDYIPAGFAFIPGLNPGWGGSLPNATYQWGAADDLLPGESDTISIYLRLLAVGEPTLVEYTNYAEISFASDTTGADRSNTDADSPLNGIETDNPGGQPLSPADDYIDGDGTGVIGDGVATTDQDNHDPAGLFPRIVDLALKKQNQSSSPFSYGDTVALLVSVINQGTITLDSIEITDYLPVGFSFPATKNPDWVVSGNNLVTVYRSPLAGGASAFIPLYLVIQPISDLTRLDSAWINFAEISRGWEGAVDVTGEDMDSPWDDDPTNNPGGSPNSPADDYVDGDGTGTFGDGVDSTDQDNHDPVLVPIVDLALRKVIQDTLGDNKLSYGDTIKFGIQLFNQGNVLVDSIVVTDSIPAGFSFVSGSLNAGWILIGQDAYYSWGLGDTLFPGESDTVCIYLTLNMVTPSQSRHWINFAEISFFSDTTGTPLVDIDSNPDDTPTNDPGGNPNTPSDDPIDGDGTGMPGDTSRTMDEDDQDPAGLNFFDLALVKMVAPGSIITAYNDSAKFLITVVNQGTEPVDSIVITDTLPAGLMFDASLPINSIWTDLGNELKTTIRGRLNPGEDTTICLALRALKMYDYTLGASPWINRAEISQAYDTTGVPIVDIDSPLNDNYGDNRGGQPESPADDEQNGDGTGVIGDGIDTTDQDNADPALLAVADLALRKVAADTLGDNILIFGDTVKIAIQVFNQGSIPVDSFIVNDSLPAGLGFVTGPLNTGWNLVSGTEYAYHWGAGDTLFPGESDTLCIYVIFQLGLPGTPETYTNRAEISAFFGTDGNPLNDVDSWPDDNQINDGGGKPKTGSDDPIDGDGTGMPGDTSRITDEDDQDPLELGFFDIALRKTIAAGSAATYYGDTIKFDLTIINQGSIPTDSIIIRDSIPVGFSFDPSIPGNAPWTLTGNIATRAVSGFLLTGFEDTVVCIWLTVEPVLDPAARAGAWINYAEISETWLGGIDISILDIDSELNDTYGDNKGGQPQSPADNEVGGNGTGAVGDGVAATDQDNADPAFVDIVDLALRKVIIDTLGDATLNYGDTVKFLIQLFNQGNIPMDSLTINDTIPNGYSFDPNLNPGWSGSFPEVSYGWGGDTLNPGDSVTICIFLRLEQVNSGIPDYTNRAEISFARDTAGVDRSADDIDSPLNDNYADNIGGRPETPADDYVLGDGKAGGTIGDGVAATDQDNADPARLEIVDVALRKIIADTLGNAILNYGDTIKFAIHIFNQGTVPIDSMTINDSIPNGFSFVNDVVLNAGWTALGLEANYAWGLTDTLQPGESDTICIYLRLEQVNTGIPDYTNRAEISYATDLTGADRSGDDIDSPLNDTYADNKGGQPESPADDEVMGVGTGAIGDGVAATDQDNADPALVSIVDLALRKIILDTLGDATLKYGDTIKFAIHLFNQGNVPIEFLTVNDTLPNGFSFVDNALNTGWTTPAGNETEYLWGGMGDTLQPGESDTICIYLRLEMNLTGIPDYTNKAEISEAFTYGDIDVSDLDIDSPLNDNYGDNAGGQPESPADDEVTGIGTGAIGDGVAATDQDNADPAYIEVLDLALRKTVMPGASNTVIYGDTANFNISVINQGTVPLTNVKITDSLPDGFTNDPGVNPGWTPATSGPDFSVWCFIITDTLYPGDTIYLPFNGIVEPSVIPGAWINYAEITSMQDTTNTDRSGDDIDSSPDGNVGSNDGGGLPESEADDETNGDGTGTVGDGVASTDEDDEDPATLMLFDLALKKVVDPSTPGPYQYGDTVKFAITVFNQANIPATNIVVSDSIPAGYIYDPSINPGWTGAYPVVRDTITDTIDFGDSIVTCLNLILQPVIAPAEKKNAWTNLAEISYAEDTSGNAVGVNLPEHDSWPDENFSNDAGGQPGSPADNYIRGNGMGAIGDGVALTDEDDADPALVEVFDLALTKQIDTLGTPFPYTYDDLIKFKIKVINQGNVPAVNIEVTDYIPVGFAFDAGSNPDWVFINDSTAQTTILDTLFADQDTTVYIYLRLLMANGRTSWTNVAEISYAEDTLGIDKSLDDADHVLDDDRTNNAGSQVLSPNDDFVDGDGKGAIGDGVPATDGDNIDPAWIDVFDLALIKTTPKVVVVEGQIVDFYITVYNQGNIDAQNIKIIDYIPSDMTYSGGGWTTVADSACLTLPGTLAVGDSITVQIDLQVNSPVTSLPEGLYNFAEINSATDILAQNYPDIDGDFDSDPNNDPGGDLFNDDDNNITGNGKRGEDEDNHDGAWVAVCGGFVCNNQVTISLDDDCSVMVVGDDVLENPTMPAVLYRVVIRDATGRVVPNATFTRANIGYCYTYTVDVPLCPANSCWGKICVEDKFPPQIDCAPDTVLCSQLSNIPVNIFVNDNCSGPAKVSIASEQFIDYGCDSVNIQGIVIRRLLATDIWGNTRDCEKYYYIRRVHIADVICPRDTLIDCSLANSGGPFSNPSRSGAPRVSGISLWPNNATCKLTANYSDELLDLCGEGYKIIRTWIISDWCLQTDTMCRQLITVKDMSPPSASNITLPTVKAAPHDCRALVQLDALGYSDCGSVTQEYRYPYIDPATGAIKYATGKLPAKVYIYSGTTVINVTLKDACENRTIRTITVSVQDETAPTPVCHEFTQVTVDPVSCWSTVEAKSLDNGSHDNCCGELHYAAAHMDSVTYWRKYWNTKLELEAGKAAYKLDKVKYDALIEDWINCYVFADVLHFDDCGSNDVILRVYEACGLPRYDEHVWPCTPHQWFCYNTYLYMADFNFNWFDPAGPKSCDYRPVLTSLGKLAEKYAGYDAKYYFLPRFDGAARFEYCTVPFYFPTILNNSDRGDGRQPGDYCSARLYNDCMIEVLVDDKQSPVVDHLQDITVYCDQTPAGTNYARLLCKTGEYYNVWPGTISSGGTIHGYYGGSDHITNHAIGVSDHGSPQAPGCPEGNSWSPIYCRDWLLLDQYDQAGKIEPRLNDAVGQAKTYFSVLVQFDKYHPVRALAPHEFSITDNCRLDAGTLTTTDVGSLNSCGEGWFQRTWTIKDKCGNEVKAVQKVIVKHRSDYEVVFPADLEVNCSTPDATDTSKTGKPFITDDECENIGLRYVDEISTIDNGACYKIIRTWTLIDWCIFDANIHTYHPDVIVDDRLRANSTDRACEFRNLKDNGDGYMKYVQIIKVYDSSAPVITCRDSTFCIQEGCTANIHIPLQAIDNCSEKVLFRLEITRPDGSIEKRTDVNAITGNFSSGLYQVKIIGKDKCNNEAICITNLVFNDCKAPTPYCLNGIATVVMPSTGTIEIWAKDLDRGSSDNCSPNSALRFSFSNNPSDASRVFRCSDILNGRQHAIEVQIWVTDNSGNQDWCKTYILLQDNGGQPGGVCKDTTVTEANINGRLYTEDKEGVEFATVEVKGVTTSAGIPSFKTASDGSYAFNSVQMVGAYVLKARRDDNPMNGVSTLDMILIQKHILGTEQLKSPYKMIAADINNSDDISVQDLIELRKLILGMYEKLPNNTSWKFIPKSHQFVDARNPWGYPTEDQLKNMEDAGNVVARDFVGVKIGDVNSSAIPHSLMGVEVRGNDQGLVFEVEDHVIKRGDLVRIDFRSPNFRGISGWQGTMSFDSGLEFIEVSGDQGKLQLTKDHIGRRWEGQGMLTMSWNNMVRGSTGIDVKEDEVLFTLIFRANKTTRLSESLRIGSQYTRSESYEGKGELGNLSLRFIEQGKEVTGKSELYQNYPNPFDTRTVIGLKLSEGGKGTLKLYDVTGRTIKSVEKEWTKGYQEVWIDRREIGATGVLYYRFESSFFTDSKKMIMIE